jgi:hypothetical protein
MPRAVARDHRAPWRARRVPNESTRVSRQVNPH